MGRFKPVMRVFNELGSINSSRDEDSLQISRKEPKKRIGGYVQHRAWIMVLFCLAPAWQRGKFLRFDATVFTYILRRPADRIAGFLAS